MTPLFASLSRVLRPDALLGAATVLGCLLSCLAPQPVRADVAAPSGDRSSKKEKDSDDKKKEKRFDFLPEAQPGTANFLIGHSVDVELVAAVGSMRQTEFIIRQQPKFGTLSAIRPDLRESNKAIVTYTHRADGLLDSFTYSCRVAGGSWSAPATVTLVGARLEPKIEVVGFPQFGRVFLGGEGSARVALRNKGSADFKAELTWPEPFLGPPTVEVPRGGVTEFSVFARPTKTGDFRHEVLLQPGNAESRAIFYVVCMQALSVSPSRLVLTLDSSGERSGVLSLANARQTPVRVVMKHPSRLQAPEETEIAGNSRSDLRISLPAGDVESFTGEVLVVAGEDVQRISVEAQPKPAILQVMVPANGSMDFGEVDQRTLQSREVVLSNSGGATLIVQARARPPFSIPESSRSIRIEPRAQFRLKVSLNTDGVGLAAGELALESNSSDVIVALAADVRESTIPRGTTAPLASASSSSAPQSAPAAPAPGSTLRTRTAASTRPPVTLAPKTNQGLPGRSSLHSVLMAVAASKGLPMSSAQINPYLASVSSIEVLSATRSEVVIAWPKPALMPPGWVLETSSQVLDPNTGIFVKIWTRFRDWEVVPVEGDRVAVRMMNLQPASQYEVRVLAVDREGKFSEPGATRLVQTELPVSVPGWVWTTLTGLLLGIIAYRLYVLRRDRMAPLAA